MLDFSKNVIEIIQSIPKGKVITYKLIAEMAGCERGSRQVARLLHTCTVKYNLPWHRVISSKGNIVTPQGGLYEAQYELLTAEGVYVKKDGSIDLEKYLWMGETGGK